MNHNAGSWIGRELGTRSVSWDDSDVILFALAVGARTDQLDLVFERDLRVLPTFGLTLAQWAPDALGSSGAFDVATALHGAQQLTVMAPMPSSGETVIAARVSAVWDKGSAAVFEVTASCEYFEAAWSIFAPGCGGFGGERGSSRKMPALDDSAEARELKLAENSALLYRLTGDRHHIHVDPDAASAIGQPRPILHGLATLSSALLVVADIVGCHSCDLIELGARFSSVVFPGDTVSVRASADGRFRVDTAAGPAIDSGTVRFASH